MISEDCDSVKQIEQNEYLISTTKDSLSTPRRTSLISNRVSLSTLPRAGAGAEDLNIVSPPSDPKNRKFPPNNTQKFSRSRRRSSSRLSTAQEKQLMNYQSTQNASTNWTSVNDIPLEGPSDRSFW